MFGVRGRVVAASAVLSLATAGEARADCIEGVTGCCPPDSEEAVVVGTVRAPSRADGGPDAQRPNLAIERVGGRHPAQWTLKAGDELPLAPAPAGQNQFPDAGTRVIAVLQQSVGCVGGDSGLCEPSLSVHRALDGGAIACVFPTSEYRLTLAEPDGIELALRADCYDEVKRRLDLDADDRFCGDSTSGPCAAGETPVGSGGRRSIASAGAVAAAVIALALARSRATRRRNQRHS